MKKRLSIFVAGLAALFLCPNVKADSGHIVLDQLMPIPTVAAYSSTFSIRTDGMNKGSAQVVVTSVTQTAQTFNDGRASTATFTVVSYTALSTATATGKITISSDTALVNGCISGGGPAGTGNFNVCNPTDWALSASTAATCSAISTAINSFSVINTTCPALPGNIIYATSTYGGAVWNQFTMNSSTPAATVTQFTGGQNNATVKINGVTLTANQDFYPVTSTAQTATNLAAAISKNYVVIGATATSASNVVFATSTVVGANTTYVTQTSSQAALTISPYTSSSVVTGIATGAMYGGSNSSYTINGSVIQLASSENLGLAQGVWFSQTTGAGGLSPLVVGTTYYVIPGASGTRKIQLSLTSTGAVAGLPIVLTSSAVKTTADVFQLNLPGGQGGVGATGASSIQWVVSNDNTNWVPYTTTPFNITIPSVSYSVYPATGNVKTFDFGLMDYGYLGLSVTASTQAPTSVVAHIIGKE